MRGILRPVADEIDDAVLRVTGRVAIGDAQAAEMEAVVRAIAMLRRGSLAVGVQMQLGKRLANLPQRREVVFMRMREENMLQGESVFLNQAQRLVRVPARVEQRRFTRHFIPHQAVVHRIAVAGG